LTNYVNKYPVCIVHTLYRAHKNWTLCVRNALKVKGKGITLI